ncbi:MAG: hypothetical protein J3Q66DRAFT_394818 [Benniella sp.]|nr:MAG: hypothetical protein J3Q66DRAFT_394818 [Benniella sp.]
MSKSTKKRILLLGFAVLLTKQINVEAAIEHNQDNSLVQGHVNRHANLVSAEIPQERQTYIRIPVINGVATPVKANSAYSQGNDAPEREEASGHDNVRFELDHEVLYTSYQNEGRSFISDLLISGQVIDMDERTGHSEKVAKLDASASQADRSVEQSQKQEESTQVPIQSRLAKGVDANTIGPQVKS